LWIVDEVGDDIAGRAFSRMDAAQIRPRPDIAARIK
jgi:hypothetical protein